MLVAVSDTHTVIWYVFSDPRLSATAKQFIDSATNNDNQIGISSITMVERVYLIEKGRIAAESFTRVAAALDDPYSVFLEIPVNLSVTRSLSRVNVLQVSDMPDRIIAATALNLNVPILSRDAKIKVSGIATIW